MAGIIDVQIETHPNVRLLDLRLGTGLKASRRLNVEITPKTTARAQIFIFLPDQL